MSATDFVQDFYQWYQPTVAARGGGGPAWVRAVEARPTAFNPDLLRALRADAEAKRAAQGELTGIDFDPFLATQDPCERYETGGSRPQAPGAAVEVYGVCSGQRSANPDVILELEPADGSWRVSNIRYPGDHTDLRTALRDAADTSASGR